MLTRTQKTIGVIALVVGLSCVIVLSIQPLRAATLNCNGLQCTLVHTTTNDFVRGDFYATGLRKLGDGEVQLLPVGLSTPWQATTALPGNRAELALVSNNNILYAIGGFDGTNYHTEIYSATTSLVGNITAGWSTADHLPQARAGAIAVIAHNPDPILYIIGGGNSASPGGSNTIYYKKIASNGALSGSWVTATLPLQLAYAAAVVRGSNLYVIGGGSSATDTVYRIPIQNSNGDLGTPIQDTALPEALTQLGGVAWYNPAHDFLYVVGGLNAFDQASQNVYYTSFNNDGSLNSWQNTSLVDAFSAHGTIQYNGAIYVIGGKQGIGASSAITKVQTALIDPDGSLHNWGGSQGNWIVTEPLPAARYFHGSTANDGGELFVVGGYDKNGNPTANVYHGSTTGAASTYAPNGSFTGEIFDTGTNTHLQAIRWSASVEDTSKMQLALYYRTANDSTAILAQPWTFGGFAAQSTTAFTNTITFPSQINNRYLQYRAIFTTTLANKSPLLYAVELDFTRDPTPTPISTNTPTAGPSSTPTPTGSATPTFTPTVSETRTTTPSPTPIVSPS